MLRRLLQEALELAPSAFDEVRPKPPDDGLVRQRRHDRARHVAREAVAQPREVRVAPDDAELAVRELLAVRGGVDLVAHVAVHALGLLLRIGDRDGQHLAFCTFGGADVGLGVHHRFFFLRCFWAAVFVVRECWSAAVRAPRAFCA